jgi:hypothetical protein
MPKEKDFKKLKKKLGKSSLKPANNATDTTFKSSKINIPVQKPLNGGSDGRFSNLISLLKHYKA